MSRCSYLTSVKILYTALIQRWLNDYNRSLTLRQLLLLINYVEMEPIELERESTLEMGSA